MELHVFSISFAISLTLTLHIQSPLLAELKDTIFRHLFYHLQIGSTFSNQFYKLELELMYSRMMKYYLLSLESKYLPKFRSFDY